MALSISNIRWSEFVFRKLKMKPFSINHSINHMKLVLVDHRHNFFHYLIVVFSRIISALIVIPSSIYVGAIGFSLSATTFRPYLPFDLFKKILLYSTRLPYFQLIKILLYSQLGRWYKDAPVWWTMTIGIPLIAMAISAFLISLFNLYYSIFSRMYNRTHCPLCKHFIKVVKK